MRIGVMSLLIVLATLSQVTEPLAQEIAAAKAKQYLLDQGSVRGDEAVYPAADLAGKPKEDIAKGVFVAKHEYKKDMGPIKKGTYYVWVQKESGYWRSKLIDSSGKVVGEGTVLVAKNPEGVSYAQPIAKLLRSGEDPHGRTVSRVCWIGIGPWCYHICIFHCPDPEA